MAVVVLWNIAMNATPSSVPGQPNTEVMPAAVAEVSPAAITAVRLTICAVCSVDCCLDAVRSKLIPCPSLCHLSRVELTQPRGHPNIEHSSSSERSFGCQRQNRNIHHSFLRQGGWD